MARALTAGGRSPGSHRPPWSQGDPGPGPRPRAHGPASRRTAADAGFLVNGHQTGDQQGPEQGVWIHAQMLPIHHHGHGCRDALIARTGYDHHGSSHPLIRASDPPAAMALALTLMSSPTLPSAPCRYWPPRSRILLLGNGHVEVHHFLQQGFNFERGHGRSKIHYILDIEQGPVREYRGVDLVTILVPVHNIAVFFD